MKLKTKQRIRIFDYVNIALLGILSLVFVVPFIHLLAASFSEPSQIIKTTGIMLWPKGFTLKGYELAFSNRSILTGYGNTMFYLSLGTIINMLSTILVAYTLSRRRVMFNNTIMFMLVFTMMFSGGLIPFYLQVRSLGLYNKRMVMILPELVNVTNIIIVRTAFKSIDENLYESAKIDGAGHFTILFKIIVPVSKATLSAISLFYAVHHWECMVQCVYIFKRQKQVSDTVVS